MRKKVGLPSRKTEPGTKPFFLLRPPCFCLHIAIGVLPSLEATGGPRSPMRSWLAGHRASRRLRRFYDDLDKAGDTYRGWDTAVEAIDFCVRKDGSAHLQQFARLCRVPASSLSSQPRAWAMPWSLEAWQRERAHDHVAEKDKKNKKTLGEAATYIYKPALGSCAEGIVIGDADLIRDHLIGGDVTENSVTRQPPPAAAGVIQAYQGDPFLIGGLKWDLRCYGILLQAAGRQRRAPDLYLFHDGLARFATRPYNGREERALGRADRISAQTAEPGLLSGEFEASRHLTNYSLNASPSSWWSRASISSSMFHRIGQLLGSSNHNRSRKRRRHQEPNQQFIEAEDAAGEGGIDSRGKVLSHKWSARAALQFVSENKPGGPPVLLLWNQIGVAVATTISWALGAQVARVTRQTTDCTETSRASLAAAAAEQETGGSKGRPSFELIGADVMLDSSGQVKLLELQRRPCLSPSSPLDFRLKTELLDGLDALLINAAASEDPATTDAGGHPRRKDAATAAAAAPSGWTHVALPPHPVKPPQATMTHGDCGEIKRDALAWQWWHEVDAQVVATIQRDGDPGALVLAEHEQRAAAWLNE